ncbi:arsenate reductase (glutaredoxin) [Noviherbaspirillum sp.]|uniref:arsenate reductase (glutaredoxin) n=1 Tax=Noviherbaspirillum sp. TaxID=1926288 RepID=UPI002D682DAC|nr:arsenate reductase (glutaredoxin) [Noviherbaspirillum sp.]HZW20172.1 arsenate reductase (glutaredoxin) [Noviherbaspirillum sp.]
MITIYHNPRCSKSREAFALVEAFAQRRALAVDVVDYLKSPPTFEQLSALKELLGCSAADMVRSNEEEFAALGLAQAGDEALLRAIAAHPKLLQRPIVVYRNRAVIARPPELVDGLLAG